MAPRILFADIETSHLVVKTFNLKTDYIDPSKIVEDWKLLCASYMWYGDDEATPVVGTERQMIRQLVRQIEKADILVGHNFDRFDYKKINTKLLQFGMKPMSKPPIIDTLKVCRKEFSLTSNKLDYVAQFLGVGNKISNPKGLWERVESGDKEALALMVDYCCRDTELLIPVYEKLKPFITNHPHIGLINGHTNDQCPTCGSEERIKWGHYIRPMSKVQKYRCKGCGRIYQDNLVVARVSTK